MDRIHAEAAADALLAEARRGREQRRRLLPRSYSPAERRLTLICVAAGFAASAAVSYLTGRAIGSLFIGAWYGITGGYVLAITLVAIGRRRARRAREAHPGTAAR